MYCLLLLLLLCFIVDVLFSEFIICVLYIPTFIVKHYKNHKRYTFYACGGPQS